MKADELRIARGLARYGREANRLGLTVFGGPGSGSLRIHDGGDGPLVVAEMECSEGRFDGGDGATREDANGLLRGEDGI